MFFWITCPHCGENSIVWKWKKHYEGKPIKCMWCSQKVAQDIKSIKKYKRIYK